MESTSNKKAPHFSTFLGDYRVAAVQPSSRFLLRRLCRQFDAAAAKLVVELGPGDGVATHAMLARLPADARMVAIERNPKFAAALRVDADQRLTVIEGIAQDLEKHLPEAFGHADAVIASIPFTYLQPEERRAVLATAHKLLRPGGTFVIFHQYSLLMRAYVLSEFGNVHSEFEPLNVFPCFLMSATKK